MELKDIREQIDKIDSELVLLLKQRFDCSLAVAQHKKENNLSVLNTAREEEILKSVTKESGDFGEYISCVYEEILKQSRELQQNQINKY